LYDFRFDISFLTCFCTISVTNGGAMMPSPTMNTQMRFVSPSNTQPILVQRSHGVFYNYYSFISLVNSDTTLASLYGTSPLNLSTATPTVPYGTPTYYNGYATQMNTLVNGIQQISMFSSFVSFNKQFLLKICNKQVRHNCIRVTRRVRVISQ
jgi:hypothetical protein